MTARPVTLITGASGGIGAELARIFAAHGHGLALVARSGDKLDALADEIAAAGGERPLVVVLDLAAPGAVAKLAAVLEAAGVEPDILVNNAGYGLAGAVATLDPADQLGIVDLNVRALVELTLHFLPALRRARGKILNVASIASYFPGPGMAIYFASKAFVRAFSVALWQESRAAGVVVSTLCPGLTYTGFQARAGFGTEMLLARMGGMTARAVAEAGYAGLMAGRRVVVPGLFNKFGTWLMPLLPERLILPLISRVQQNRR